jgi:hypothetical protein
VGGPCHTPAALQVNRSMKFKDEIQAGMAQFKDIYKDMQQVKQSQITPFFSHSSTYPSTIHHVVSSPRLVSTTTSQYSD